MLPNKSYFWSFVLLFQSLSKVCKKQYSCILHLSLWFLLLYVCGTRLRWLQLGFSSETWQSRNLMVYSLFFTLILHSFEVKLSFLLFLFLTDYWPNEHFDTSCIGHALLLQFLVLHSCNGLLRFCILNVFLWTQWTHVTTNPVS